jgi:Arm DNA-binding domain
VLRVQRRGPKIWRFEYKGRRLDAAGNPVGLSADPDKRKKQLGADGKTVWESRVVSLGEATSVTLDNARTEALALRHQLSKGVDPVVEA